jgi:hypothetical protein
VWVLPLTERDHFARGLDAFETVDNGGVVWPLGPTTKIDISDWSAAIGINLFGVVNLILALLLRCSGVGQNCRRFERCGGAA